MPMEATGQPLDIRVELAGKSRAHGLLDQLFSTADLEGPLELGTRLPRRMLWQLIAEDMGGDPDSEIVHNYARMPINDFLQAGLISLEGDEFCPTQLLLDTLE